MIFQTPELTLEDRTVLDEIHAGGSGKVAMEWCYDEGDLDMQEAGQDYKGLLDMPVKLVEN